MKDKQDYAQDIAEIRSLMERSTRFLSLSGLAGILAGTYALGGSYIAHYVLHFSPGEQILHGESNPGNLFYIVVLAIAVLMLSIGTAIILSARRAKQRTEALYNSTSRKLISRMALPLLSGGALMLVFMSSGLIGLTAPISLIFYGLALFNAGDYTYKEIRVLGIILVVLGLIATYYPDYSLILWAIGFGLMHIIFGIYIHIKHER